MRPLTRSPAPSPPPTWLPPSPTRPPPPHFDNPTERNVGCVYGKKAAGEVMSVRAVEGKRAAKRSRWDVRPAGQAGAQQQRSPFPSDPDNEPTQLHYQQNEQHYREPIPRRPPLPQRPRMEEDGEVLPPSAQAYGTDGEYVEPQRRQKKHEREGPVVEPTEAYLAATKLPSKRVPAEELDACTEDKWEDDDWPKPPLLVLDLNHTLLCRGKRDSRSSQNPLVRPYLSTFLEYICSTVSYTDSTTGLRARRPRFMPVVYSSARAPNVLAMLAAIDLIPPSRLPSLSSFLFSRSTASTPAAASSPYTPSKQDGDVLSLVFTREMMNLSEADYANDVETTKDLGRVWEKMGWRGVRRAEVGAKRTILLDDEEGKAAQQPHNHLPIYPFLVHHKEFPRPPNFAPPPSEFTDPTFSIAPPPPTALELPLVHPSSTDFHLLTSIYLLDHLRGETNISSALLANDGKGGLLSQLRAEAKTHIAQAEEKEEEEVSEREVDEELAMRGARVCERARIEVRRGWDAGWRLGLLEREKRAYFAD